MVKAQRCDWCGLDPLYVRYHDHEWGVPVSGVRALFERLTLETMQAGLSWYTVLKKREHMRRRFHDFDPRALAALDDSAVDDWLGDPGLIRHRGKLTALVGNARACLALNESLPKLVWSFVGFVPRQNHRTSLSDVPATDEASKAMSRTLKRAGFRFVGPTTCYAFMQSAGLVNDHLVDCHRFEACRALGQGWSL